MKPVKKNGKKLSLNKVSIARLDFIKVDNIYGGAPPNSDGDPCAIETAICATPETCATCPPSQVAQSACMHPCVTLFEGSCNTC